MRQLLIDKIITRINQKKTQESGFLTDEWKNIFVSYVDVTSGKPVNVHISTVDWNRMDDLDLLRLFEYVILTCDSISVARVNSTYFRY